LKPEDSGDEAEQKKEETSAGDSVNGSGNFENVAENTEGRGIIDFYNHIAAISKNNYESGLSCGKFVYDMIGEKLKNGADINKKVFPRWPIGANDLFDELENGKNKNVQRIEAKSDDDLKKVQDEADKGTLVLAIFKNIEYPDKKGEYHGHIAFVGCKDLTLGTSPSFLENNVALYDNKLGSSLSKKERVILVQAGHYRGIAPVRLGTDGWMDQDKRKEKLEDTLRFYKVKRS
jgi:hypothetical protein